MYRAYNYFFSILLDKILQHVFKFYSYSSGQDNLCVVLCKFGKNGRVL